MLRLWCCCGCCCCCCCCQALFAREDQAGGKRKVGASMLTNLFSSSIRLVGKMRVRLSTITPNEPLNITMPLQGTCNRETTQLVNLKSRVARSLS
jgi:hypothetical protein